MKLKYDFRIVQVVGEKIAVPVTNGTDDFHGALKMNGVTADILNLLKCETTEEAIIEALLHEYRATHEQVEESVHRVVGQLRSACLLTE